MKPAKRAALTTASAVALAAFLSFVPAVAQQTQSPTTEPTAEPAKPPVPAAAATVKAGTTKGSPNESSPEGETKDRKANFLPPGMMIGPGAGERFCDPRNAGFTGWRTARFERGLDLKDEQKKKLEDYKAASAKALESMVAACAGKPALTPTGQFEALEKRLAAQLDAVKALRAAFDPFYASLTDEQKARLTVGTRDSASRWERW